ncbi:TPA: DNA-binding protein, partial [Escherichia coli]|nr:DNA-binding protein [Escherichia coli]
KRTFNEINKKITLGHTSFYINLNDLELESLADNDYQIIFEKTFNKLNELGYIICENSWDADGFGIEIPE